LKRRNHPGTYIGVMDPTLPLTDAVESVASADVRALNLIGYDVTDRTGEPGTAVLFGLGACALWLRRRKN
jgi:hypothetical protein